MMFERWNNITQFMQITRSTNNFKMATSVVNMSEIEEEQCMNSN